MLCLQKNNKINKNTPTFYYNSYKNTYVHNTMNIIFNQINH